MWWFLGNRCVWLIYEEDSYLTVNKHTYTIGVGWKDSAYDKWRSTSSRHFFCVTPSCRSWRGPLSYSDLFVLFVIGYDKFRRL